MNMKIKLIVPLYFRYPEKNAEDYDEMYPEYDMEHGDNVNCSTSFPTCQKSFFEM